MPPIARTPMASKPDPALPGSTTPSDNRDHAPTALSNEFTQGFEEGTLTRLGNRRSSFDSYGDSHEQIKERRSRSYSNPISLDGYPANH